MDFINTFTMPNLKQCNNCSGSSAALFDPRTLTQQLHKGVGEASCHSRPERFGTRRSVALPNGAKVWPPRRTRWRLRSGISLPRTRRHTTSGNPRRGRIPFRRNVCARLSRRAVIEWRTGPTGVGEMDGPDKRRLQPTLALHAQRSLALAPVL